MYWRIKIYSMRAPLCEFGWCTVKKFFSKKSNIKRTAPFLPNGCLLSYRYTYVVATEFRFDRAWELECCKYTYSISGVGSHYTIGLYPKNVDRPAIRALPFCWDSPLFRRSDSLISFFF